MTTPDLHTAIISENTLLQRFVVLLEEEQSVLAGGRTDELAVLVEQKEKLAAELNTLSAQRGNALKALGHAADRAGMAAWKAMFPDQKEAQAAWENTLSLAARAQELNRVNAELLQMHLQHNSNALAILLHRETALNLYGPDGRPAVQGGTKIDDAI